MHPDEMATRAGVGADCREMFSGAGINRGQGTLVGRDEPKVTAGGWRSVEDASGLDFDYASNHGRVVVGGRSGGAMIKVEQSAQPLGFVNHTVLSGNSNDGLSCSTNSDFWRRASLI